MSLDKLPKAHYRTVRRPCGLTRKRQASHAIKAGRKSVHEKRRQPANGDGRARSVAQLRTAVAVQGSQGGTTPAIAIRSVA